MSIALWVGIFTIAGIAFTVLGSLMLGSFVAGKHSTRIENLETRQKEIEDEAKKARIEAAKTSAQMAGFDATLNALGHTVQVGFDEVKGAIRDLATRRGRSKLGEEG